MSVRPVIGYEITPFFKLALVSAAFSPPTLLLTYYILQIHLFPAQYCEVVDYYETIQCIYCGKNCLWHLSCIAFVDAYDTTVAQHLCESEQLCRSALNTAGTRRVTWLPLNKQRESMIESSRKRFNSY